MSTCFANENGVREAMGPNFFGASEWRAHCGVDVSKKYSSLPAFPWSKEFLSLPCPFYSSYFYAKGLAARLKRWGPFKRIADTHVAFLGVPSWNGQALTIMEWQRLHPELFCEDEWYANQFFARHMTMQLRWYLVLRDPIQRMESLSGYAPVGYSLPTPLEEVSKCALFMLATGRCLNAYSGACTKGPDEGRVIVRMRSHEKRISLVRDSSVVYSSSVASTFSCALPS